MSTSVPGKTRVLLGTDSGLSMRATQWAMLLVGGLMIAISVKGLTQPVEERQGDVGHLHVFMAWGVLNIFLAFARFSKRSPLAPRVEVDEGTILLKPGLWRKHRLLQWSEVSAIEFKSFQISFAMAEGVVHIAYKADAEQSKKVKALVRQVAEQKGIAVIGG